MSQNVPFIPFRMSIDRRTRFRALSILLWGIVIVPFVLTGTGNAQIHSPGDRSSVMDGMTDGLAGDLSGTPAPACFADSPTGSTAPSSSDSSVVSRTLASEDATKERSRDSLGPEGNPPVPNFSSNLKISPPVFSSRIYYEGSETLGRVGQDPILKRDIFHQLRKFAYLEFINQREKAPAEARDQFNDQAFATIKEGFLANQKIYSQILEDYICQLLLYNDYVVSRSKEELEEQKKTLGKTFENDYLPHLQEQMKCESRQELEEIFKVKIESSLEEEKRLFIQQTLGSSWQEYNLDADHWEPTIYDLKRYYEDHKADYELSEKVHWLKMTVYFSNHATREEALDKIAYMGNAVRRATTIEEQTRLFAQVAKGDSEDIYGAKGGDCGWTTRGTLNSKVIEEALFNEELPVGAMSRIIEDGGAFSILCVLERQRKHFTPFVEVQEEVAQKLKEERKSSLKSKYEADLAKRFAVEIFNVSTEERQSQFQSTPRDSLSATGRGLDEHPY